MARLCNQCGANLDKGRHRNNCRFKNEPVDKDSEITINPASLNNNSTSEVNDKQADSDTTDDTSIEPELGGSD